MDMEGDAEDILRRRWQLRGSFNEQVKKILHAIKMPRQQLERVQLLYDDVQSTCNTIWPGCKVKPFGSMVTGLALQGSDVDCFLELPTGCDDDAESCVQKSKDLISNYPSVFREPSVIIKKIPVVTFVHTTTGRHCDLTFNKPIAIEFGKLVKYLLTLDPRASKLAMLIKYWAKVQKLTGPRLLPSNALIILIIFFLQRKQILPSVAMLQENSLVNMVDRWNTGFEKIHYNSRPGESLYNLLGDFFVHYSEFDFRDLIVCPYLGYPVERRQFIDLDVVPPEFQLYKTNLSEGVCEKIILNCIICIQDPFDHARNCAAFVRPQVAGEIIGYIRDAALVYANTSNRCFFNTLLSYRYSEPQRSGYDACHKLRPNKHTKRSRIGGRSTPRGRAYRARGRNPHKRAM